MASTLDIKNVIIDIKGLSSKKITTDLKWNLKPETHRWLNVIAELKGSIDQLRDLKGNRIQGIGIPEIIVIGAESAGKSTNVNRFIGILVSDTGHGQKTLVPIKFLISPCVMVPETGQDGEEILVMEPFQIEFEGGRYDDTIDDCTRFHEDFSTYMNGLTSTRIDKTSFVEVHIRGEGLPYVNIIDFPGARTGADGPEFKRIKKYLGLDPETGEYIKKSPSEEAEAAHDLIVLVTPLSNNNGGDIVATAISNHLGRGISKEKEQVAWEQHMRVMIEDEARVLVVGTNVDKIGEKNVHSPGISSEDIAKRQYKIDLEQIHTVEQRVGLVQVSASHQTIQDVLPGVPWVLCMAPRESTFGESVNREEAAFFQNSLDQYWKDIEELKILIGTKDKNGKVVVTDCMYKMHHDRYKAYRRMIEERAGLENFREILNCQYIECLKRQREKIAKRISKVAEDAAKSLQRDWQWADSARNHSGLTHPVFPEDLREEHNVVIMKDILAIVYSEFNALFKEKFLNNEANYTFPDSRRDPDGKKTIASRKEAAENLGEEIIKQSKALRPYAPLQNLVKKYFNDQLAGVYDTGGSFLSKFVEKTTFFENMFGANYPQDITTSMISMMLITNVASIGGLTLIKCASKPQDLPLLWFKAIEKPLPEFTDIHKKYLAAHRTLIRVDETFKYSIPAMPSIQKRSKTDIKDFVIPIPIEYTSDKSVEEWISLHKAAKFRNIQMARAFDPRKIEMMDTLVTHLPWQFWLDAIPEKVILAWKRDKQKKEQAEEDKVEKPTLGKRISRRVSRIG